MVSDRKNTLLKKQNQVLAEETYRRISAALDTGQWREARKLVYEKQDLLSQHLDDQRRADCLTLVGFFRNIDKGDRLAEIKPPTGPNLDTALESYRQAVAKGQTLPAALDVGLIARQKIRTVVALKDELAAGQQSAEAQKIYAQIMQSLTPEKWPTARTVLTTNETLLSAQLAPARRATITRLLALFQFIEDGDRLTAQQPITADNLNMALSSYRLADQKARDLAPTADLTFLTAGKIEDNRSRQASLDLKNKQARMVAQEAAAATQPAALPVPKPPVPKAATAPADDFDHSATGKAALRLGMKSFSKQKYGLSMRYFRKVYAKQIGKLEKAGKKQSFTILGLHPAVRAEVIFLV